MRLIDADANREDFMERVYDILLDEPDNIKANLIIDAFDEMPTAYNPDKVVEQLKDRSTLARPVGWTKSYEIVTLEDAIDIVKGGGVDEMEE